MTDAVWFRSDAFSLEPTPEGDRFYDLPLGDDLAAWLREQLLRIRPDVTIEDPVREDWGTVLLSWIGGVEYRVNVQWLPAAPPVDDMWGISFDRPSGCLAALLGRRSRPEESQPIREIVARVLADEPAVCRDVQWVTQDRFDAGP
jgi:hypothetical protein